MILIHVIMGHALEVIVAQTAFIGGWMMLLDVNMGLLPGLQLAGWLVGRGRRLLRPRCAGRSILHRRCEWCRAARRRVRNSFAARLRASGGAGGPAGLRALPRGMRRSAQ